MTSHTNDHDEGEGRSEKTAYETRDVKIRPLVVFIAGLTAVTVVAYLVIFVMFKLFSAQAAKRDALLAPVGIVSRPSAPGQEHLPPEPRIQVDAAGDLKALRDQEDAVLTTYGWVDRRTGVVRVPIEVAMKKVLEQGLPYRQPDTVPPATGAPARAATPQGTIPVVKAPR